jgi:hypothetical protein
MDRHGVMLPSEPLDDAAADPLSSSRDEGDVFHILPHLSKPDNVPTEYTPRKRHIPTRAGTTSLAVR